MKMIKRTVAILMLSPLALLFACAAPPPYIFGVKLRSVSDGVKVVEIADQVMVCYNAEWATPSDVTKLAAKECAKTKRNAAFVKHDYLACPLLLPARAYFSCTGAPTLPSKSEATVLQRHGWPSSKRHHEEVKGSIPVAEPELPPELPIYLRK